jgi:hypothetical protein
LVSVVGSDLVEIALVLELLVVVVEQVVVVVEVFPWKVRQHFVGLSCSSGQLGQQPGLPSGPKIREGKLRQLKL